MIKTAIIGGGPAGAYCACCLTESGIHPTIFDSSHPREKPCGGVVTSLAQKKFPFLRQIPIEHSVKSSVRFISPSGKQICRRLSSELISDAGRVVPSEKTRWLVPSGHFSVKITSTSFP